jgi:hypothetical protein
LPPPCNQAIRQSDNQAIRQSSNQAAAMRRSGSSPADAQAIVPVHHDETEQIGVGPVVRQRVLPAQIRREERDSREDPYLAIKQSSNQEMVARTHTWQRRERVCRRSCKGTHPSVYSSHIHQSTHPSNHHSSISLLITYSSVYSSF